MTSRQFEMRSSRGTSASPAKRSRLRDTFRRRAHRLLAGYCPSRAGSRLFILTLPVWLAAAAFPLMGGDNPATALPWRAGAAVVDITPDRPMWLAGYGGRNRPSEGVAHRIFAKALALEELGGGQMIFVTLDLIHVPRSLREAVEKSVAARHGIGGASLLLNASHTHSAPAPYSYGVPDPAYAREGEKYGRLLVEKVVELIGEAVSRRKPARLHYGRARAGFAMNRRLPVGNEIRNSANPDGPVDHDVPVLRVTGADGKLGALLFGYACHNTVTGFYTINGDYAGYAQAFLEAAHPGTVALFMMGAGGDQNPYPRHLSLEQAEQHGRTLANAVEAALAISVRRPLAGPLRSAYGFADLPYASFTRAELETRARSSREVEKLRAVELLRTLDADGTLPRSYPCPVQVVSFGPDLTLVAIGGETTVDYSLRLKRELATTRRAVWVAGYSNDGFGYLGSRRVLLEGGYEGHSANLGRHPAAWAPEAEENVVSRVHDLIQSLGR